MNIDKGNQASKGEDMTVLGNIASPDVDQNNPWVLKTLDSNYRTFTATTDGNGVLWLIVGTDSGFQKWYGATSPPFNLVYSSEVQSFMEFIPRHLFAWLTFLFLPLPKKGARLRSNP